MRKTAIVLTTINVPTVLEKYIENCKAYGHKDVFFVIVGDRKSPPDTATYIESLQYHGYHMIYLDIAKQEDWLRRVCPEFGNFLPYDVAARRNIGFLYAAEAGAEVIVTIDDDNYPLPQYDYVGEHNIVGQYVECKEVSSSTGWFNPCSLLKTKPQRRFYHRGFPVNQRWRSEKLFYCTDKVKVIVNAGLWIGDPDVDTITRLEEPFKVVGLKESVSRLAVAPGTMAPFNTQNTSFSVEVLPCFYVIACKTGKQLLGGNLNFRYDDIWMSYFLKKIADHIGDAICFGLPLVEQRRNKHDYLLDLSREIVPMRMTVKLMDILENIKLTETSYFRAYYELIQQLRTKVTENPDFNTDEQELLNNMLDGMALWLAAVAKVMSL